MNTIPDTANYMIAGYAVFAIVMIAYLVSLYSRWQNLKRDEHMLNEIDKS